VQPGLESLAWDSHFFGHRIGRIRIGDPGVDLDELADDLVRSPFDCVYVEVGLTRLDLLGKTCRRLLPVDIRVELSRAPDPLGTARIDAEELAQWVGEDRSTALQLAEDLSDWSRFSMDPRLAAHAPALYRMWIHHAFEGRHQALITRSGRRMAALVTYRIDRDVGHIELVAVLPQARGKGLGTALVRDCVATMGAQGAGVATVRTQLRNLAALRMYESAGFRVAATTIVLHWWRPD
jgi:dTDP-4-amino-4,6-dideoxy-D-galactose acyltransferase